MDEKVRPHIANPRHPARAFVDFLSQIANIVTSAFAVTGEVERVGRSYRELALRSVSDATDLLERAERSGKGAPFVFFACMQDAVSAVKMFAAAADQSVDDGQKEANLVAFSGAPSLEQEASEKFQLLFDNAVERVMTVLREAVRQSQLPGSRGAAGKRALIELGEVKRLIERAAVGRMGLDEGLGIVDQLDAASRRVAAAMGIPEPMSPVSSASTGVVHTGRVKWWNDEKGYGFLVPDGRGPDVFVHYSVLVPGCVGLQDGQRVSFRIIQLAQGPGAEDVRPI